MIFFESSGEDILFTIFIFLLSFSGLGFLFLQSYYHEFESYKKFLNDKKLFLRDLKKLADEFDKYDMFLIKYIEYRKEYELENE